MNLESLRLNAQALLDVDAKGALVPHGMGNLARNVIEQFLAHTAPGANSGAVYLAALGQLETGLAFIAAGENEESRMAARLRAIAAQALAHEPDRPAPGGPALFPAPGVGLSRNKEALLVILAAKLMRVSAGRPGADLPRNGLSRDRAAILAMVDSARTPQNAAPGVEAPFLAVAPPAEPNRAPTASPSAGAALSGRPDRCRPENYGNGTACATCGRSWGHDGPDECPLEPC